jgi:D-tyrosyl-tRNA(Tyr) deacylase
MKALIQRVNKACVRINDQTVGAIDQGLLVFLAVQHQDNQGLADRLLEKILNYRVFSDQLGKMNLNVQQIQGQLLIISQFTLAADTQKGLRPGFSSAAKPTSAKQLYDYFITQAELRYPHIAKGEFGADMKVELINDGPVTFLLEV